MHPDWVRDIRDRCTTAGVPFFFKQWGAFAPLSNHATSYRGNVVGGYLGYNGEWSGPHARIWGTSHPPEFMLRLGKKEAGRVLDGRTWDEYPT
jgi:protein gp37